MSILDALTELTELYTKVVGSAPAPADNIGDMIHALAENWPEPSEPEQAELEQGES